MLLRRVAAWIARHEFWLVWVVAAPLLLSSNLPRAILYLALATLPLFWLAREARHGHMVGGDPAGRAVGTSCSRWAWSVSA